MNIQGSFFKTFCSSPKTVGAIAPSSRALADLMCQQADVPNQPSLVELGPGTGVFTKSISEQLTTDQLFFALEIDDHFAHITRKAVPQALVYTAGLDQLGTYLALHGRTSVDCIISGIPRASIEGLQQGEMIQGLVDLLPQGGRFVTFAYLHGLLTPKGKQFKRHIESKFSSVSRSEPVRKNIPPAVVYTCEK